MKQNRKIKNWIFIYAVVLSGSFFLHHFSYAIEGDVTFDPSAEEAMPYESNGYAPSMPPPQSADYDDGSEED